MILYWPIKIFVDCKFKINRLHNNIAFLATIRDRIFESPGADAPLSLRNLFL